MNRTHKKIKSNKFVAFTSEEMFDFNKTKYDGYGVGHGIHGGRKYNRKKENKNFYDSLGDI